MTDNRETEAERRRRRELEELPRKRPTEDDGIAKRGYTCEHGRQLGECSICDAKRR